MKKESLKTFKKFVEDFHSDVKREEEGNETMSLRTWKEYLQHKQEMEEDPDYNVFEYPGCNIARVEYFDQVIYFVYNV